MIYHRTSGRPGGGEGDFSADRPLETKAAYWEPRIKTYGFQRVTDLCLFEVTAPLSALPEIGAALVRLGEEGVGFHLAFSHGSASRFELSLLVSLQSENALRRGLSPLVPLDVSMRRVSPAELVFFQGPHFGDRYGIFHTAARTLEAGGVAMLAWACSVSCIYIVLPNGTSAEAVQALSGVFEIPARRSPGPAGGA